MAERLRRAQGSTPGPRRAEARRLGDAMRLVIDRLATSSASLERLAEAADQLEAVASNLEGSPKRRLYDGFAESANAGDAHAFFDWSPLLGRSNALAPPIIVEGVDGRVIGRVRFGAAYEGPPGCVHGGFIAAGFDEVLGLTNSMSGAPAMTANLTVRYRQPTPLHRELKYVGVLVGVSGRKVKTRGELWAGDTLTAEAQGLFVRVGMAKFVELMEARETGDNAPRADSQGN
jgi:acyl-coenzyme A thioesterase PaaI-like protein